MINRLRVELLFYLFKNAVIWNLILILISDLIVDNIVGVFRDCSHTLIRDLRLRFRAFNFLLYTILLWLLKHWLIFRFVLNYILNGLLIPVGLIFLADGQRLNWRHFHSGIFFNFILFLSFYRTIFHDFVVRFELARSIKFAMFLSK